MWSFFSRDPSKDFPCEIGEPVQGNEGTSVWSLHKAKKKVTGEEISVFVFDMRNGSETQFDIAKAAVKRLKTLRHPSILTYLDSLETEKVIYLATEYVEPLRTHLTQLSKEGHQRDLYIAWGIFQITRALSFLNNDGNLRHNNVCLSSVFVNTAGEWKLGGVEYVAAEGAGLPIKILPLLDKYDPPEKTDTSKQRHITKCSTDMWGLGCLIWETFNGVLPQQASLKELANIPKQIGSVYCELVGANPGSRPNPADIITRCRKPGGYFKNDLVDALLFLEEMQIKDKNEKNKFFSSITAQLDNFPDNVCKHKILPQLITAFEYGEAGSAVLAPMFKLGRLLDEADYQKKIVPCVVKLFSSNDRATRIRLLQQLEHFIGHMKADTVNDQIYPQIAHGFFDTNATIREQTVKSVIYLAPKLNYNNLNVEVLKHFARLQSKDDQGGIRTNTTVCLGKIAQHLHPQIRQKVLISAFIRAMRDPFPPSRSAGILALAATQQYFLLSEVAMRILPALCQLTTDSEKTVRDSAFRTLKGFLGKLEKVSEDPSLRESMEADVHTATPSLSNAAATWAGWAVTAVTAKFYRSQSDTVKSITPLAIKTLSKPGSLEQPSSSSISTTTSSVTSMTSLEQEGSKGDVSVSDYDETWESENWGDMDAPGGSLAPGRTKPGPPKGTDGWDTEEWGSLEEEGEVLPEVQEDSVSPAAESWNASDFAPIDDPRAKTISSYNWGDSNKDDFAGITSKPTVRGDAQTAKPRTGWDENEWEPVDTTEGSNRLEEARKKREEKKLQRQKELEARRVTRGNAGPMKLGSKMI